ncbi:MAG: hypothetical protein AVDCRST_MAG49-3511, partial [uncultured Thermomicrobiales bacterium]
CYVSLSSTRRASGTFSTRTSPAPYVTVARMVVYIGKTHRVPF